MLEAIARAAERWQDPAYTPRREAVAASLLARNRFTAEALRFAIDQQMAELTEEGLRAWLGDGRPKESCAVAVFSAGNVPFAGLQDLLAVCGMGHRYLGKVSRKSPALLPAFAKDAGLRAAFVDTNKAWQRSDAVIVTGGDETIAWAEVQSRTHSISSERCLLRSHSISVAVLDGNETPEERAGLAEDVLLHEGLGCRSVAAIWAPAAVVQVPYVQAFTRFRELFPTHPSTGSTVRMDRAFLQALGLPYAGGPSKGFLLSVGAPEVQRPGHVRWVHYKCWAEVLEGLKSLGTRIQCVFAREGLIAHLPTEPPPALLGQAQRPPLSWQPDSLDTVAFLRGL